MNPSVAASGRENVMLAQAQVIHMGLQKRNSRLNESKSHWSWL